MNTLKDPLIFLLLYQYVSHPQSGRRRSPSLPRLSPRGESRAAGKIWSGRASHAKQVPREE